VNAKGATLADETVEQERGVVSYAIVGCEEFLEFIDDEEDAGHTIVEIAKLLLNWR
jgi:hypothetical protein